MERGSEGGREREGNKIPYALCCMLIVTEVLTYHFRWPGFV